MTWEWVFANVALPALVVAIGYVAVRLTDRTDRHTKA